MSVMELYYRYMPIDDIPLFITSGLTLAFGKKIDQNSPEIAIAAHNQCVDQVQQVVIAALTYMVAFYIAPGFGYTIPARILVVIGLIFPAEAALVARAYIGVKSIEDAVVQGSAGNLVGAAKDLSVAIVAYFSTTPRFYNLRDVFYTRLPPKYVYPQNKC